MLYEDYLISIFWRKELNYKFIYVSSYVLPNIAIKTLQEIYKMLLYVVVNVVIKPN